jgi:exopolysaccharide biosynthesis polyprenyl glycosylphosphotransferase
MTWVGHSALQSRQTCAIRTMALQPVVIIRFYSRIRAGLVLNREWNPAMAMTATVVGGPTPGSSGRGLTRVSSALPAGEVPRFGRAIPVVGASTRKVLVVLADWVAIYSAFVAATWFSGIPMIVGASAQKGGLYMSLAAAVGCVCYARAGLYVSRNVVLRLNELKRILQGSAMGLVVILASVALLHAEVSRRWSTWVVLLVVTFVVVERDLVRRAFRLARRSGQLTRSLLIIGSNAEAIDLYDLISQDRGLGYEVLGFVDDHLAIGTEVVPGVMVVGGTADVQMAARGLRVTGALIAATAHDAATTNRCVRQLADDGFHVQISSTLRDIAPERLTVMPIGTTPALYLNPVHRRGLMSAAKRATDIAISSVGLMLASPVVLLAGIAIRIESRGPVLFRQERAGKGGTTFRIVKLRTMVNNAEELRLVEAGSLGGGSQLFFKAKQDSRITRVGAILRRTSIDEIPQLLNILRGDMSLVGPRPLPLTDTIRGWDENAANRLRVRPGLTGMWQVSGRSTTSGDDAVRLDLYYVDNWSLWVDLAVLARTIPAVFSGRGAV